LVIEGGKSGQHRALHLEKLRVLTEESVDIRKCHREYTAYVWVSARAGDGENVR